MNSVRLTMRQLFVSTVVAAGLLTLGHLLEFPAGATLVLFGPLLLAATFGRYLSDNGCLIAVICYPLLVVGGLFLLAVMATW